MRFAGQSWALLRNPFGILAPPGAIGIAYREQRPCGAFPGRAGRSPTGLGAAKHLRLNFRTQQLFDMVWTVHNSRMRRLQTGLRYDA